jgi:hypothetical protein
MSHTNHQQVPNGQSSDKAAQPNATPLAETRGGSAVTAERPAGTAPKVFGTYTVFKGADVFPFASKLLSGFET